MTRFIHYKMQNTTYLERRTSDEMMELAEVLH